LREAARSRNITLVEVPINTLEEMKADLDSREKSEDLGIDAILLLPDHITLSSPAWNVINDFAKKHNLPVSAYVVSQVKEGALFHYGNDYAKVGEKAATLADKILQGVPPSELPVLSPEEYLRINMVTAETLQLSVPDGLLKQAVEIIH
jgi:putative ABC transport system substrate-binding protein